MAHACLQRLKESHAATQDVGNKLVVIWMVVQSVNRLVTYDTVSIHAERALKPDNRLFDAGVNRAVKHDIRNARCQKVAFDKVPILFTIDRIAFVIGHRPYITRLEALAATPRIIGALNHALIGSSTRIILIVDLAAFMNENFSKGPFEFIDH
jgi:hypothetical protein